MDTEHNHVTLSRYVYRCAAVARQSQVRSVLDVVVYADSSRRMAAAASAAGPAAAHQRPSSAYQPRHASLITHHRTRATSPPATVRQLARNAVM